MVSEITILPAMFTSPCSFLFEQVALRGSSQNESKLVQSYALHKRDWTETLHKFY